MFHDEIDRRRWQNPEQILHEVGLRSGLTFIDLGCGKGFFAIPAAKIVGKKGKVYCVDRNPSFLEELKGRSIEEGLNNIHLSVGKAEDTVLCKECADIVFFGIVLHDFDDPTRVLKNSRSMLKPTGTLVNVDWKKMHMNFGPSYTIRFTKDQSRRLIEDAGFIVKSIKDSGSYHYTVVAVKR